MNDNATSEGVHLRWIHFREEIVSSFELLLNNEDFADVTLSCDGRQVRAHKVILSSCSPYFRDLFKNNPCQHPIVILQDVPFDTLNSLLLFIYCGEVEVNHRSLPEFLKIASTLKIKGLTSDPKNSSNHKIDINNMNTVCDESADQDKLDSICQESQFTCAPDNDKTDSGTMNANLDLGPQINYCPSDVSEGQPFSVHIGTKLEPEEITIDEDIPESAHLQDSSKDAMCHDMFEDSQVEEYDLTTDYSPYDEEEAAATQVHKESQGDNSVLRWLLMSPAKKAKREMMTDSEYYVITGGSLDSSRSISN